MSFNDADTVWEPPSNVSSGSQIYPTFQKTGTITEEEQVTENIKQLLNNFNVIKSMTQLIGKKQDTKRFREKLNDKIIASGKLIREIQSGIKRLDTGATRKDTKQNVKKLSKDFEERLNTPFQQLIRQSKEMMEEIPLLTSAYDERDESSSYDERDRLLEKQHEEEQFLALQDETDFQDSLIHEREREIKGIQSQVIEVNEIFRDIARIVEDQGELVENIQTHISTVVTNVKTASEEVDEAKESQQSSRKKLCFIALGVVIIVAVVVVVVLVLLKSPK